MLFTSDILTYLVFVFSWFWQFWLYLQLYYLVLYSKLCLPFSELFCYIPYLSWKICCSFLAANGSSILVLFVIIQTPLTNFFSINKVEFQKGNEIRHSCDFPSLPSWTGNLQFFHFKYEKTKAYKNRMTSFVSHN